MFLPDLIQDRYLASVEALREAALPLAEPIARAAELMVASLMDEGRILTCGQAGSHDSARLCAALLCHQYKEARPGLAALALDGCNAALSDAAPGDGYFARQVETLGHAGDALFAISQSGDAAGVVAALHAAHRKGMRVVALVGGDGCLVAEALNENDVVICTPGDTDALTRELHLRAIHSLCDGIDYLLLGV